MSCEDIVRALRCTSTPGGPTGDCKGCPYYRAERLTGEIRDKLGADTLTGCDVDKVGMDAAERIEQLAAENEELRAKLPRWRSAEEELPEKDGWYLCAYAFKEQVREARFYNVLWYHASAKEPHWMEVGGYGAQVTHWMPLPGNEI